MINDCKMSPLVLQIYIFEIFIVYGWNNIDDKKYEAKQIKMKNLKRKPKILKYTKRSI